MNAWRSRCSRRCGFSMVEALVGVTITTVAGAALLTSIGAAVQSSTEAMHVAVARGLAEQLMDEIAATRFPAAYNPVPSGQTREMFDDLDDYAGWSAGPPVDRQGHDIGTEGQLFGQSFNFRMYQMRTDQALLNRLTREVDVERIRPDTGSGWTTVGEHTNFRRVSVRVKYTDGQGNTTTLAETSRIFSYVPVAP